MSDLKSQIIEKGDVIISNPMTQKVLAATPLASGSAAFFEVTQGWLAIASILVGIIAGVLVAKYNWTQTKVKETESKIKDAELELIQIKLRKAKLELEHEKDA